jgi:dCMP deaminase
MRFALLLAARSTCARAQVGCVITDAEGLQVLGIGYNGNAATLPNSCDQPNEPGNCGCLHAELNALLKAPGAVKGKVLYTTTAPCVRCAKAIINGGVAQVYYAQAYRDGGGLAFLRAAGIWTHPLPTS